MNLRRTTISKEELEVAQRLLYDYQFFARHIQKIEPKDLDEVDLDVKRGIQALVDEDSTAGLIPFIFRPGQLKLHYFVEEMKLRRGKVRAALVKPRQVGWSTYIQGRAHWLATKIPGFKVFIVSHTADSTRKFLRRARKMCAASPPTVTPGRPVDNSKEIVFANGSSYGIATAGSPDAVRSDAFHFSHNSEEPYWPDAETTIAAIIPALSDGPGSEAFRESTSRGKGTPWHNFILETIAGENEWELFFDAWFNDPRYRMPAPEGWTPDEEAREAQALYKLDMDQLYWRAMKIKTLRALWRFKQEFPGTVEESFQSSENTLYDADAIYRARKNTIEPDIYAPLIMGVDPARTGDRTVIAFRQGRVFHEVIIYQKMDDMQLAGIIANYLQNGFANKRVARCFIDYAIGEGPASRLRELGFSSRVTTVNFGEGASEERYQNKRIEMAMDFRDWLGDGKDVSIPDSDDVSSDLLAIPDFIETTGSEKLKLPPKKEIKKLYGKSPDIFDAMILTFAYPVPAEKVAELQQFARHNLSHLKPTELSSIMRDFEQDK
jgi:hypothetical protein